MSEAKKLYICQFCDKIYKRKSYYERHSQKCQEDESEIFNLEGLIEEWKDIDPEIANCFEVELQKFLKPLK
jgi:hypothetical protein